MKGQIFQISLLKSDQKLGFCILWALSQGIISVIIKISIRTCHWKGAQWSLVVLNVSYILLTRTKTSIRYAKENDREKRERKKGTRRDIEREGEIREKERDSERESERERERGERRAE